MKEAIKRIFIFISRILLSLFYSKQYMTGKYYDHCITGWLWGYKNLIPQKIIGLNRNIPWPVSPLVRINNYKNIEFSNNDQQMFHNWGNYFQNFSAKIIIGEGSWIAPGVGLITANHNQFDLDLHADGKPVIIGKGCWIGMNSVILPGVTLGNNTIVGAGSIVTKSFHDGNCMIAGNPAKKIKELKK